MNNRQVESSYLEDGDVVGCGQTRILVSCSGSLGDATADWVPTIIPGYELHEEIGRGNMGIVYRATMKASSENVAIKVLTPKVHSQEVMQLFIREASILNKLSHQGIVQFREFGVHGDHLYLAMEYIDAFPFEGLVKGRSVGTRIRRSCALACQLLRALHHAHMLGLVHRDVKPANVLLCKINGQVRVKLADFGLAKNFENAGMSGISSDGQLRGTPAFMAPDQVFDCRASKPSVDIYAVAATLYFWITGHYPIDFASDQNWFAAILEKRPTPVQEWCPEIPASLAAVLHRALEKKPEDRFPSAAHFVHALHPFAAKPK